MFLFSNDLLQENPAPTQERKFLVYESALYALMAICTICSMPCRVVLHTCKGSMVTLKATCSKCGHNRMWSSQPMTGQMPRGNLDIASAILCSGSTAAKAINMMRNMRLFTITTRTFIRIQKYYLIPAINKVIV